ncbi:MAG: hypothetical protein U1F76_10585 [Candidatus Competibacteraceae bacterium]
MLEGNVGIGTPKPGAPLHVARYMAVGPFAATAGTGGIDVTGPTAELGFVQRNLTAWPSKPVAGDRFVWYNQDGSSARLWTEVKGDLLTVSKEGNVTIQGDLRIDNNSVRIYSEQIFCHYEPPESAASVVKTYNQGQGMGPALRHFYNDPRYKKML